MCSWEGLLDLMSEKYVVSIFHPSRIQLFLVPTIIFILEYLSTEDRLSCSAWGLNSNTEINRGERGIQNVKGAPEKKKIHKLGCNVGGSIELPKTAVTSARFRGCSKPPSGDSIVH